MSIFQTLFIIMVSNFLNLQNLTTILSLSSPVICSWKSYSSAKDKPKAHVTVGK